MGLLFLEEDQMKRIAVLVDGGFYKKRAKTIFGEKSPEDRANELFTYCIKHIYDPKDPKETNNELYRIFYYDCYPSKKVVYHPLTKTAIDLQKAPSYSWNMKFFNELMKKRKVALRMGELIESDGGFVLTEQATKRLCNGSITVSDLTQNDFSLDIKQKGVDMRIGLDIASMAYKKQVDRIVLIAGDSDFVPAAKHARREGIDFILDPMWQSIKPSLQEHIDGLQTRCPRPTTKP